jgi:hypothetical protein
LSVRFVGAIAAFAKVDRKCVLDMPGIHHTNTSAAVFLRWLAPGHVGRFVGREEQRRGCDVVRGTDATERDVIADGMRGVSPAVEPTRMIDPLRRLRCGQACLVARKTTSSSFRSVKDQSS